MKSHRHYFLFLAMVILSRLPFFTGGYGVDGDAWRTAKSALLLWSDGIYAVSRFPGFPVFEIIMAPIIGLGGSLASNLATFIIFLIALHLYYTIVKNWNLPHKSILLVLFAFLPIIWKNSAITMDYIWGLCGILASVFFLQQKRIIPAGICLALAAGTRITHIAYILPFLLFFERDERNRWLTFAAITVMVTLVLYIPVVLSERYYFVVMDYLADVRSFTVVQRIGFFLYRIVFSIGLLGAVGIGIFAFINLPRMLKESLQPSLKISAAAVLTGIAVFAGLSDEREYLMPIFPFALILLAHFLKRTQFIIIAVLLISYGFISVDVIKHSIDKPTVGLGIERGYLVKEFLERREQEQLRLKLAGTTFPDSSFVMIGAGPMFWLNNPLVEPERDIEKQLRHDCAKSKQGVEVYFVYSLYKPQLDSIRQHGFKVYYREDLKSYFETFIGYQMNNEDVIPFKIQ